MMQTYIVYVGTLVVSLLSAKIAQMTKNKNYIYIAIAALSLVSGLRNETVGLDTVGYIEAIENISNGRLDLAYGMEWTFRYICASVSFVVKDPQVFLLIFAVITNALVVLRLWDFREYISLSFAVFVYYTMFYFASLNLTRQFIAIAIVFYATRYLLQGKNIRFLIYLCIACCFHTTALLGVIYVYFNIFNWRELSKRHKWFLIIASFLMPIAFVFVYSNMVYYSGYISKQSVNIGLLIVLKLIILIVTTIFLDKTRTQGVEGITKSIRFVTCAYFIGLALTSLGYVFKFVDRIGLYFYVFEAVYFGYVFKQRNTRFNFIIKLVLMALYLYLCYGSITGTGQGQFPYLFCWQ